MVLPGCTSAVQLTTVGSSDGVPMLTLGGLPLVSIRAPSAGSSVPVSVLAVLPVLDGLYRHHALLRGVLVVVQAGPRVAAEDERRERERSVRGRQLGGHEGHEWHGRVHGLFALRPVAKPGLLADRL